MVSFSRALIAIGILIAFCQSVSADDSASSASIRGGAVEAVYSEPSRSQNGRFSDLRDAYFDSGTYSSKDLILRGRLDAGDGIGLDGRVVLGLTNLAADARRSYDAGDLKLSHRYIAVDMSIGSTWYMMDRISSYVELAFLYPAFKNEVTISGTAGKIRYRSDYGELQRLATAGVYFGAAIGIDIVVYENWIAKVHVDAWPRQSGKGEGAHWGIGYVF